MNRDRFVHFIERILAVLAEERYDDFIAMYASSRISKYGLILVLRYLDSHQPALNRQSAGNKMRQPPYLHYRVPRRQRLPYRL